MGVERCHYTTMLYISEGDGAPAAEPDADEPDADELAEALRRAVGRFVRATRRHVDTLPPSRAETLRLLDREGPRTMADVAAARDVSHQSVSRMVADLERLGLADRAPNPADGRGFVVVLTDVGRAVLRSQEAARRDAIAAAIAGELSSDERAALARASGILDRLADAVARQA